ncbi:MAG TPA: hypothetical protein VHS96_09515, partial [Bacteroidia bacterium]|nr:hypothetical protein [Bacteroidia bacterium]
MRTKEKPWSWMGFAAGAGVMLLAGFLLFGPTGRDDVYKTLWPAFTFADSGRILNYNGDALEQSSSLLHVLVLGGLHRLTGLGLPDLNFIFIIVCGLASLGMTLRLSRRMGIHAPVHLGLVLGMQAAFVYWAMGGLDSVLAALVWLLLLDAVSGFLDGGRPHWMVFSVLLTVLVRPEGAFVAMAGLGAAWSLGSVGLNPGPDATRAGAEGQQRTGKVGKRLLMVLGAVLAAAVLVGCWRIWHSGQWWPQPVAAKSGGFGVEKTLDGLRYLWRETLVHPELAVLWGALAWSGWSLLRRRLGSRTELLALGFAGGSLGFVVLSGGDWMENGRFLVPVMPLLVLVSFRRIGETGIGWQRWLKVGWICLSVWGLVHTARWHSTGYPPWLHSERMQRFGLDSDTPEMAFVERYNRVHLRDIAPLAALRAATQEVHAVKRAPVTILSQQAGMMAFHLAKSHFGRFRFIDLVGLCTPDFTDCPVTKARGNFRGGLNMDLMYFFDDLPRIEAECGIAAPDIVFGLDDSAGTL